MSRSVLLAVAVGFGVVALQIGSAEAKDIKGQSPSRAVNPLKTAQHQGGHLVSEPVHLGPASPVKTLPPAVLKNIGNDKNNTNLFGGNPVVKKLPPGVLKAIGNDRFNTGLFGGNPVTWGGHPPRFPPPSTGCGHDGCDHNGCNHCGCDRDGCDYYGCDRHHDCRHSWDWMFCGDMCSMNCYGNTCSDFAFDFCW